MKIYIAALATALTFATGFAEAYCVYNETDNSLYASQTGGFEGDGFTGMAKTIKPDGKECCNWKTDDCNHKGKKTSDVFFMIRPDSNKDSTLQCGESKGSYPVVWFDAAGYAKVVKNPDYDKDKFSNAANPKYKVIAYNADGKRSKVWGCHRGWA